MNASSIVVMSVALLTLTSTARGEQCWGRLTGLGNDSDGVELAVTLASETPCGCVGDRFVVPATAVGRRAMHADLLLALASGIRVALGFDHDPETAPWCYLRNVSLVP